MGASIGLCGVATPIFQDMERKATHNNVDSQISREVTHLFLTTIFRLEGEFINLGLWAGWGFQSLKLNLGPTE